MGGERCQVADPACLVQFGEGFSSIGLQKVSDHRPLIAVHSRQRREAALLEQGEQPDGRKTTIHDQQIFDRPL